MENNFDELVDIISSLNSVTAKSAKKISLDILDMKERNIDFLTTINKIESIYLTTGYCKLCNKINSNKTLVCTDCQSNNSRTLVIVKNQQEYENLRIIIELSQNNSFILMIKNKSDLISFLSFQEKYKKFERYLKSNPNFKEIIYSLSHTDDNEILLDFIRDQVDDSISFYTLAKGLPIGNSVEYIDQESLVSAFNKKVKFK